MHKRFLMILAMVSIACSTIFGFGSSERNAAISNSNENTIFLTENPNFVVSLYSDGEKTNFSSGAYKYNPNQKYNIECSSVSEKNIIKEISFFSTKDYSPVISPIIVNKSTYSGEIQFPATKEGITIHISSDIRQFNITCRSNAGMWRYDGKPIKNNSIINITPGDNKTLSLEFDEEVYYVKSKPFEADIINGKQVEISTRNISSNGIIEVLLGQYIHIDVPTEKQLVLYKNSNYTRRIERSDKFKPGDIIYAEISDLDYFLNEVPGCKIVENPSNNAKTRRYTIQIGEITGLIRFSISEGTTVEYDSDIDDLFYVDLTIDNEIIKKGKLECRIGAHYSLSIQPRLELDDDIVLIHDGNRPMLSRDIISDCIAVTRQKGNAIACIPCQEAMLETSNGETSNSAIPREHLRRTQTPHGFKLKDLISAHDEAAKKGITNSIASCTLMIELGKSINFSSGSEKNIKLTTQDDLDIFKALLKGEENAF